MENIINISTYFIANAEHPMKLKSLFMTGVLSSAMFVYS